MTVAVAVELNACAAEDLENEFFHTFSATTATAKHIQSRFEPDQILFREGGANKFSPFQWVLRQIRSPFR